MLLKQREIVNVAATILILIWVHTNSITEAKKIKNYTCPIGFNLSYTADKEEPICYRLKGPEPFTDKFVDCSENMYSLKVYNSLIRNATGEKLWTEHKTSYPGGPFIDWSYGESTGDVLTETFDVKYDSDLGIDEELCTVLNPSRTLEAVRCDEKHFRYCFVHPYERDSQPAAERCAEGFWRARGARAACVAPLQGAGGAVRATWRQARALCGRRGGSLLQRGWRHAAHPALRPAARAAPPALPLGITLHASGELRWLDAEDGTDVVPDTEWSFGEERFPQDVSRVALVGDEWTLVNSSYVFYSVTCEQPLPLRRVSLNVTYDAEGELRLAVNDSTVDETKISCFTDSVIFYPSRVKITRVDDTDNFILKPLTDGYYWCVYSDSEYFHTAESNKELFIREKTSVMNLYAIKIQFKGKYNFESLEKLLTLWSKKLSEYIFLRTKYEKVYGDAELSEGERIEDILKQFKAQNAGLSNKQNVLYLLKLKRVFVDGSTALLHAQLNPAMSAVAPGDWGPLRLLYMRPAYYCRGFGAVPTLPLGNSTNVHCSKYSCVGEFSEGVQWVTSRSAAGCGEGPRATLRGHVAVSGPVTTEQVTNPFENVTEYTRSSSEESTETEVTLTTTNLPSTEAGITETLSSTGKTQTLEYTTAETLEYHTAETILNMHYSTWRPPKPTLPPTTTETVTTVTTWESPEDQLQSVLENLEQLLHNDTEPISKEHFGEAVDQVESLLSAGTELEIPGQFLQLLDELGARVELQGQRAAAVRPNVALLAAEPAPDAPVRGLRLIAADLPAFSEDLFHILTEEVNSTHLEANASEVVVVLPSSVALGQQRVSFVVFRTEQPFRAAPHAAPAALNSRVLSVTVHNLTSFQHGEVIDLHFRPLVEQTARNESRACAYWAFLTDGSGEWRSDGCELLRGEEGALPTCRCHHLTHFAEVLMPRAVFSEADESALEVISVVGCALSVVGLLSVALTALLFRSWRRDFSNKIWLQLCLAILLLVVGFLTVVLAHFESYDVGCMLLGIVLHYAVLSSFCWMLVAAVLSYRRLVLVFTRDASHKLLRASAFSWGAPFAIIGVLLSVSPNAYGGTFEEMTPNGAFCYPTGVALWLTVYAPIALMLLANWSLFALIVRSVFASRRIQRHGDSNEALRCASVSCLLVFLFGLPWVFGLFAFNIVAAYLFTLTATFQGFVLFIFFVVGNKKTRDLWLNKLRIKRTRKIPVTSSTYTNSNKSGPRGGTSLEASLAKPRSLASTHEARFS